MGRFEDIHQITHARYQNGLVCEYGLNNPSLEMLGQARPIVDLQNLTVPIQVPNTFNAGQIVTTAGPIVDASLYSVPANKVALMTAAYIGISMTVTGTITTLRLKGRCMGDMSTKRIFETQRGVSGVYHLDFALPYRILLGPGEEVLFDATLAVALASGTVFAGIVVYEFCDGVNPWL